MSNSGSFTMTYDWVAERKKWDEATREGLVRNFFKPNIRISIDDSRFPREAMKVVIKSRRRKEHFTCGSKHRSYYCHCPWCERSKADEKLNQNLMELRIPIIEDSQ